MFLIDNPNRKYKQYTYPRRGGGYTAPQIVLHTYEAPYTRSLLGAATWLTQRDTPGSYHALAGARSTKDVLQLAPWSYETWHCVPSNNWSIGISAVAYAADWNKIPASARENLVKSMAYAAANAAKWLKQHHGRVVQPRLLTRAQAMRKESGFVYHGTMDPGRRTDPGKNFPWSMFIAEFKRLTAGGSSAPKPPAPKPPAPKKEWDELATKKEVQDAVETAVRSVLADRGLSITEIRKGQSLHAGKVHTAFNKELDTRVLPVLENLASAIAATNSGEKFDQEKFLSGVRESVTAALAGSEEALRQAVTETVRDLPDRDVQEIAQAVVDNYVGRLTDEEGK